MVVYFYFFIVILNCNSQASLFFLAVTAERLVVLDGCFCPVSSLFAVAKPVDFSGTLALIESKTWVVGGFVTVLC